METDARRIGEFLVGIDAMTRDQLNEILVAQIRGDRRLFGEIAIARKYINDDALKRYVEKYCNEDLPDFGECLEES